MYSKIIAACNDILRCQVFALLDVKEWDELKTNGVENESSIKRWLNVGHFQLIFLKGCQKLVKVNLSRKITVPTLRSLIAIISTTLWKNDTIYAKSACTIFSP